MAEYLDRFIRMLRSEKYYSPHTCSNYRRDLQLIPGFSHRTRAIDSAGPAVSYNDVSGLRCTCVIGRAARAAPSQRELSSIRSFYQYLICKMAKCPQKSRDRCQLRQKADKPLPKTCDPESLEQPVANRAMMATMRCCSATSPSSS